MELKDLIKIIKKDLYLVAFFAIAGLFCAILLSVHYDKGFTANRTFFISSSSQQPASNIAASYLINERSASITDSAVAIIASPDFANGQLNGDQSLKVRKLAPQVIRLTSNAQSSQEALAIIEKTKTAFNEKLKELNGEPVFVVKSVGEQIPASEPKANRLALAIFGALVGITFGMLVLSLKIYFKI